jgi:hypothetical protein
MLRALFLILAMASLVGCATHATIKDSNGQDVMLAGHDPVAYFKVGGALRGMPDVQATHEGRTYYFATASHQQAFLADPTAFEPQFGGYCSNGIPYGVKTFADPREFELRDGRLFVFADMMERQLWSLDPSFNILKGEEVWRRIEGTPEFLANVRAKIFRPSWHRDSTMLASEWRYRNPTQTLAAKPSTDFLTRYALNRSKLPEDVGRTALGTLPLLEERVPQR